MLSKKTKYGLKALAFIARQKDDLPLQVAVISERENISHKFLESILLTLKKAGFLGSKKRQRRRILSFKASKGHLND